MNLMELAKSAELGASPVEESDVAAVNRKENRPLYKAREPIYPKLAHGTYRRIKWAVMAVTLAVYYLTPWIRWDRGPNLPDQAVLIDFPARRFYFFFIEIWPQEVYYLTGLLILASFGLFLITALAGRVWCGYTCPQTVWTDLFIMVERLVEGDRAERIRLAKAPMSPGKAAKRVVKHGVWLLIAMATGGAWVFYFADAPSLLADLLTLQAMPIAYITIAVLTFTTYALGGLMREQVCTYMCPWPRIQAAMQDEDSLIVSYKDDRGEPRLPYRKGQDWSTRADCIDCRQCVAVCPMGIDIRDGQQLECIACALCIDACDDVMAKIGRPRGLIDYDTLSNHDRRKRGEATWVRWIRPRTILYAALIVAVAAVMVFALGTRSTLDVNVQHDRNPLFVRLTDGSVRNGYTVKILNKEHAAARFAIAFEGLPAHQVSIVGREPGESAGIDVASDRLAAFRVFVSVPAEALDGDATDITVVITEEGGGRTARTSSIFRGPEK